MGTSKRGQQKKDDSKELRMKSVQVEGQVAVSTVLSTRLLAEKMIWYEMKKRSTSSSSNIFYSNRSLRGMKEDPVMEELRALSEEPEEDVEVDEASSGVDEKSESHKRADQGSPTSSAGQTEPRAFSKNIDEVRNASIQFGEIAEEDESKKESIDGGEKLRIMLADRDKAFGVAGKKRV